MNSIATANETNSVLSREQIEGFYQDGYISPINIVPSEDMAIIRQRIEDEVLSTDGPNPSYNPNGHCRHLDNPFLSQLCRSPALIGAAQQLMGPDLQVWSTNFWTKEPGGTAVPWHQDIEYWPLNPPVNLTFWLAIDKVDSENSCVQVIPGSHREIYQHLPIEGQMLNKEAQLDEELRQQAVLLELEPGQAAIFNERLLHYSKPNTSNRRRMGMGIRIIPSFVKVDHDDSPLYEGHQNMLLCGNDPYKLNRIADL